MKKSAWSKGVELYARDIARIGAKGNTMTLDDYIGAISLVALFLFLAFI